MKVDAAIARDHGFPELPKLVFLDTNVVQNLHSFGEFIYEDVLDPMTDSSISAHGPRFRDDIFALADFMSLGRHCGWPIAVSPGTIGELGAIQRPDKRHKLTNWANGLLQYFSQFSELSVADGDSCDSGLERFTAGQRCWLSELLEFLPQESDRQLVIDALERGCDVFLTMDYKTIWRYRDDLNRFGLQVMRPVELLEHIKPWAGLLC